MTWLPAGQVAVADLGESGLPSLNPNASVMFMSRLDSLMSAPVRVLSETLAELTELPARSISPIEKLKMSDPVMLSSATFDAVTALFASFGFVAAPLASASVVIAPEAIEGLG